MSGGTGEADIVSVLCYDTAGECNTQCVDTALTRFEYRSRLGSVEAIVFGRAFITLPLLLDDQLIIKTGER